MKVEELIIAAGSVYPEVSEYIDQCGELEESNSSSGDTLAAFIAQELASTFDASDDDGTQLATAIRAIQTGVDELQAVAYALSDLAVKRLAA